MYLGINISHHPSIALYQEGKIIDFFNEERFLNYKGFFPNEKTNFYKCILDKIKNKIEVAVYTSFGRVEGKGLNDVSDEKLIKRIQKQLDNPVSYFDKSKHHIYHACSGFYFSPFTEATCIVVDGGGAFTQRYGYQEVLSIMYINKNMITTFEQLASNNKFIYNPSSKFIVNDERIKYNEEGTTYYFTMNSHGGDRFQKYCAKVGLENEPGKLMGLSCYEDEKFFNPGQLSIAKQAQEEIFKEMCDLVDKVKEYTKCKNIVLSGGVALNCLNNFKLVKKYSEYNFFVDPVPHDGGTAIGACVYYDRYRY
jgi:carbamoyltransferase